MQLGRLFFLKDDEFKRVDIPLCPFVVKLHELLVGHKDSIDVFVGTICKVLEYLFGVFGHHLNSKPFQSPVPIFERDAVAVFEVEVAEAVAENLKSPTNICINQF